MSVSLDGSGGNSLLLGLRQRRRLVREQALTFRPHVGHTRAMADRKAPKRDEKKGAPSPQPREEPFSFTEVPAHVPADIRDVSFPISVRGYDRRSVDAYINRVNRVIAELEVSRSPQSAVRHAVDRVADQTKAILQQARESAEKITTTAREEADAIMSTAKAEAAELVVNASAEADRARAEAEQAVASARAEADDMIARSKTEAEKIIARSREEAAARLRRAEEEIAALQDQAEGRMRELLADTEAVWNQRHELLGEIHRMATRLQEVASAAAARSAPEGPTEPVKDASQELQPEAEAQPTGVAATNESTAHDPAASAPGEARTTKLPGPE
jgi:DivIVA domain-containing protein